MFFLRVKILAKLKVLASFQKVRESCNADASIVVQMSITLNSESCFSFFIGQRNALLCSKQHGCFDSSNFRQTIQERS